MKVITVVYPKQLTCPSCATRFSTLVVHVRKDQPVDRASEFHHRYVSPHNPYDYELWVCPNDMYAAVPVDFDQLTDIQRQNVRDVVEAVVSEWEGASPNFNADQTLDVREKGFIWLAIYRMRGAAPERTRKNLRRVQLQSEQHWAAGFPDIFRGPAKCCAGVHVAESGLRPFASLAHGIQADYTAVVNGLKLPSSTGHVEGTVTRVKLLKRQSYGRTSTRLLRRRITGVA